MEKKDNPYAPGAGTRPPFLAGRDSLIEDFGIAVDRAKLGRYSQHMLLSGLRGLGKTSLVNEFGRIAKYRGVVVIKLEARVGVDFGEQIATELPAALRVMTKTWKGESVKRIGSVVSSFMKHFEGGFNVGVIQAKYKPSSFEANTGDFRYDLRDLLMALGEEARSQRSAVVLLLDELQNVDNDSLGSLVSAMHATNQDELPVFVVGAGLPTIARTVALSQPYAERMFRVSPVGPLDFEATSLALVKPVVMQHVDYSGDALSMLFEETGGYPFFVQVFGKHCWDVATSSPIDLGDVESIVLAARSELDSSFYAPRFERATDSEKRYLNAMAGLGFEISSSGVAEALGKDKSNAGRDRRNLIDKGLIYVPERGQVAFTVPRMAEYLLNRVE